MLKHKLESIKAIRFRLYARDAFSNYGKVFTQYYSNLGGLPGRLGGLGWHRRTGEQRFGPIVRGDWPVGSSVIGPSQDQTTPLRSKVSDPNAKLISKSQVKLEIERARVASLQEGLADKDKVIDNLRQRLDREREERRNLPAILSDQIERARVASLQEGLADKDKAIDDLRQRLDREQEERRNLAAILTDQIKWVSVAILERLADKDKVIDDLRQITPTPETASAPGE
jgi:hypothetical protein